MADVINAGWNRGAAISSRRTFKVFMTMRMMMMMMMMISIIIVICTRTFADRKNVYQQRQEDASMHQQPSQNNVLEGPVRTQALAKQ